LNDLASTIHLDYLCDMRTIDESICLSNRDPVILFVLTKAVTYCGLISHIWVNNN
jgi:hypothetical protein